MYELIKIIRGLIETNTPINPVMVHDLLHILGATQRERDHYEQLFHGETPNGDEPMRFDPCIFCHTPTILLSIPKKNRRLVSRSFPESVFDSQHYRFAIFCTTCKFRGPITNEWETAVNNYEQFVRKLKRFLPKP